MKTLKFFYQTNFNLHYQNNNNKIIALLNNKKNLKIFFFKRNQQFVIVPFLSYFSQHVQYRPQLFQYTLN